MQGLTGEEGFEKPGAYYRRARIDLLSLIPENTQIERVLDIGCGEGSNTIPLKAIGAKFVVGIEINHRAAMRAKSVMDLVIEDSIERTEKLPFSPGFFDLVICGDVLEHLINPWKVLEYVGTILRKEGLLLLSIPNIRNWKVLWDLILKGRFRYEEAGILDNTHLRFFTKAEIRDMLMRGGFFPIKWSSNQFVGKTKLFDQITLRMFHDFFIIQHHCLAQRR